MTTRVKCNKCGYVGEENEFPKGRDFFQNKYISRCAKQDCDNRQTAGDASIRMMPGTEHPFSFVRPELPDDANPQIKVMRDAGEAS